MCPAVGGQSRELFEVSCTQADGFDIKINEGCRTKHFPFVDFTNSFVWGDSAIKKMATPSGSAGTDVVAGWSGGTCTNVKLASTGAVTDSDGANSWNLKMPLTNCGIAASEVTDATTNKKYIEYALYWNSQLIDSQLATQQLYQIGQVKMTCRVDPFQLDAPVVKVTEDADAISDPAASRIDIRSALSLKIRKFAFTDTDKVDEAGLTAVTVTSTVAGTPVLSQTLKAGSDYTDLAANDKVAIGDYMELKLVDTSTTPNEILLAYS